MPAQTQSFGHHSCLSEVLQSFQNNEKPPLIRQLLIKAFAQISSLPCANKLYTFTVSAGLERYGPLSVCLIDLYSRCDSIKDAHSLFRRMLDRKIGSYNTIMAACVKHGHHDHALAFFADLLENGNVTPNKSTFIRALEAASRCKAGLLYGMIAHSHIIECELQADLFVANNILSLYNRCCCLDEAMRVFKRMPERDVVSWTTVIDACVQLDKKEKALQLLQRMQSTGVEPNAVTFMTVIKLFNTSEALSEAKEMHNLIQRSGLELDPLLGNTLISMYGKCGNVNEALAMYRKLDQNDVIAWNSMLGVYAQQGFGNDAVGLFRHGFLKGLKPTVVTFVSSLDACACSKALEEGQKLHFLVQEKNMSICDIVLETAVLNMYGKCGNVEDAKHVFGQMAAHNIVSWTAIISTLSQYGYVQDALGAFSQVVLSSIRPNNVTIVAILEVCTSPALLTEGKIIHFIAVWNALDMENTVKNALLNMYSNCGQVEDAANLFKLLSTDDVIAWTAMIEAYSQHGYVIEAFEQFARMLQSSIVPSNITFVCVLDACTGWTALVEGKLTHAYMVELQVVLDRDLETALVNMYSKCGSVEDAHNVFGQSTDKDVVSWNVMLAAYAQHGHGKLALQLFQQMENHRVDPNGYTFLGVLNACSHAGLVELGHHYLSTMKPHYGVIPTSEHYVCMVDLLGRAGQLQEAERFINKIPLPPSVVLWTSFLGSCKLHGSLEWGAVAAENVRKLEPQNLSAFVVLSNLYAALGGWNDFAKMGEIKERRSENHNFIPANNDFGISE